MIHFFQSLTEDVNRQVEREKALQKRYGELQEKIREIQAQQYYEQQDSGALAGAVAEPHVPEGAQETQFEEV